MKIMYLSNKMTDDEDHDHDLKDGKTSSHRCFAFGGGGILAVFHCGVASYLQEHCYDSLQRHKFAGVSAGSIVATALSLNVRIETLVEDLIEAVQSSSFWNLSSRVHEIVKARVPEDVSHCSDRLKIGTSRLAPPFFIRPSQHTSFPNKPQLLDCIRASCNLPPLFGFFPTRLNGGFHYDGYFTQNWSCLPVWEDCEDIIRMTTAHNDQFTELRKGWITPRILLPLRWLIIPPGEIQLRSLFRLGYWRAKEYFLTYQTESKEKEELEDTISQLRILETLFSTFHS